MTQYTVIKPFFIRGGMVSPGDSVELSKAEFDNCHTKIVKHREKKAVVKKTTTTRKPTNRQAKVDSVREDDQ